MNLSIDEVRRLTGPNLLWDRCGAILDVWICGVDKQQVVECWQRWARIVLDAFDWPSEQVVCRVHEDGANLAISAPLDALYTACDVCELIWELCVAEMQQQPIPDLKVRIPSLVALRSEEANPALVKLINLANEHGVSYLLDEDEVSLGFGQGSQTWPLDRLPSEESLTWSNFNRIPSAYITGTNGKSTSVRLAAEIAQAAGLTAGITSTDFIRVGDHVLDYGDYSGPGGARRLLRDERTQVAFLEVARGGILRRGLPVESVDAALVTNVASDHLGQYGINTVSALAETKFVVSKALGNRGVLVLNAENAAVVKQAECLDSSLEICWFAKDPANSLVAHHVATGGRAVTVKQGEFYYYHLHQAHTLGSVENTPITFGGAAQHNIENILGVIGLCMAMNLSVSAIQLGLQGFSSNPQDNPGRGNHYVINGVRVIVDFAHNEHSMKAVVDMATKMPARQRHVMFSHAGDRSNQDIENLTNAVVALEASNYTIAELPKYLRGRQVNEISDRVCEQLSRQGISAEHVIRAQNPLDGAQKTVALAKPEDVVLLFVLDQRGAVHNWLTSLGVP